MGIGHKFRLAIMGWAIVAASSGAAFACNPDRATISGDFGRATFSVQVADTTATRAKGLMHVETLPTLSGMLFVYEAPKPVSFWMRNTLIPLDMLFAGSDGTILRIHPDAIPLDETVINGGENVQFVLEINGGLASRLGIKEGDTLEHPAIFENVGRRCE